MGGVCPKQCSGANPGNIQSTAPAVHSKDPGCGVSVSVMEVTGATPALCGPLVLRESLGLYQAILRRSSVNGI